MFVEGDLDCLVGVGPAREHLLRVPHNDGVVAASRGEQGARGRHRHPLDPVRVALRQRLQTGAAEGVPHADGRLPRTGNQKVGVRGDPRQAGHFVLVARQGLLHCECLQVPELDCHVCGARRQQVSVLVEGQKFDDACVALQGAFVFALFKVPQSNRGIFGSGRYKTIHGVHGHLGDVAPVARHRVLLWLPGQPVAHLVGAWAAAKGIGQSFAPFASGAVFHLLDSFFEVPNLPLQLHQRGPFLF